MERINWTDRVRNQEVLQSGKEKKNNLQTIKKQEGQCGGHILRRNCLLKRVIEGKIEGKIEVTCRRGTRRKQIPDDPENKKGYWKMWRTRFAEGSYGPVVRQAIT
jgi:hypothetical protein